MQLFTRETLSISQRKCWRIHEMGFNSVTRLTAKILIKRKAKNTIHKGISAIIYRWRAFNGIFVKLRKARASYTFFWSLSQEDLTITSENENPMSTVESSPTASEKSFQSHPSQLTIPYHHLYSSLRPARNSHTTTLTSATLWSPKAIRVPS